MLAEIYIPRKPSLWRAIPILLILAAVCSAFIGVEAPISPYANNLISLGGAITVLAASFLKLRRDRDNEH